MVVYISIYKRNKKIGRKFPYFNQNTPPAELQLITEPEGEFKNPHLLHTKLKQRKTSVPFSP